jgi:hypothetical protein
MSMGRNSGWYLPGQHPSPHTEIKPGQRLSPATEIKPGQRLGQSTEFKPGERAHNRLPIGSVTIRIETTTHLQRAWIKVAEPNVWRKRAIVAWETVNGALPRGYVVHHIDRNSLNDAIDNLSALTRREHAREHELERAEAWVESIKSKQSRRQLPSKE